LMCPNCSASMTEVKRNDVAFDMCPTCRGVWLDRGELEKIITGVQSEQGGYDQAPQAQFSQGQRPPQQQQYQQQRPQQGYGERGEYGEGGEYGERGDEGYDQRGGGQQRRRRGGFDLMDIFGD
jgi:uncharacterized protein